MFALIWINFTRNKARKVLTLLSLLIAFVLFGLLMALKHSLTFGSAGPAAARILVTVNKAGLGKPMPVAYAARIATVPGVVAVSYGSGTLGMYQKPGNAFLFIGVAGKQMFEVQPFLRVAPVQKQAWFQDRSGALVTPKLLQKFAWKIGERIPVQTPLPQKDGKTTWYVTLDGVLHDPTSHSASKSWWCTTTIWMRGGRLVRVPWSPFPSAPPIPMISARSVKPLTNCLPTRRPGRIPCR